MSEMNLKLTMYCKQGCHERQGSEGLVLRNRKQWQHAGEVAHYYDILACQKPSVVALDYIYCSQIDMRIKWFELIDHQTSKQ